MLVKFTEEDRLKENELIQNKEPISNPEDLKNFVDESARLRLTEDDLKKLEDTLLSPPPSNEKLMKAAEEYKRRGELLAEIIKNDEELGLYDDTSDWDVTLMDGLEDEEPFFTEEEMENIFQEEPTEEDIQRNFSTIEPETENIFQEGDYVPSLSDEEIMNMNQDEYERNLDMEDEFDGFVPEPFATPEEVEELKIDVVLETPIDDNIINVVIDEDVLIPPTQTNPLPTPNEQVIKIDFSLPEDPTLVDTDVEKKNS
jgi:hypothetical protein